MVMGGEWLGVVRCGQEWSGMVRSGQVWSGEGSGGIRYGQGQE